MKPRAVLGIGSAHGDDRAGWQVIELLQQDPPPDTVLQSLDNPGAALLQDLQQYSRVILVDACDCCAAAGSLFHYTESELRSRAAGGALSSHRLGLAELLQLAAVMDISLPPLRVFAVQIADCQPMAPLSASVAAALPELARQIRQCLTEKETMDV